MDTPPQPQQRKFPCTKCGANLEFAPGEDALKCPYCGTENRIAVVGQPVEELDFRSHLRDGAEAADQVEVLTVKCAGCGAEQTLAAGVTADRCKFCGSPMTAQAQSARRIKPRSLLPFAIAREKAVELFRKWLASLWFAPTKLKSFAEAGRLNGLYIPYWTYDADTQSAYTGERGDDYWVTETYQTMENGKSVTRTRQVRKTRWHSVSGRVSNSFDDILILASASLPRHITEKLEPWDLENLVPFDEQYLAGFVAEAYQVNLEQGFDLARPIMDEQIRQTICRDIGGDHQRIHSVNTSFGKITFKHLLLPLWLSAYRYHEKSYRFLVNARTGEVAGERPWSFWKIFFLVLTILAVAGAIALVVTMNKAQ
jgi:DNA-directed RNA polymerase subunit RPC12/RpoP